MLFNFLKTQTVHAATKIQDAGIILNQAAGPTGVQQVPLLDMVGDVLEAFLALVGIVFFVMIVYGAYMWFASAGADDKIKKGRGIIITSISGLMIVLAANALTVFVFDRLTTGNITIPTSGSGLGTDWGGPVGGDFGNKAPEPTGCCIDRVGEYNFARRVTTESDCIAKQAGDAYSKDLVGEEKTGEAATGVRGQDWDFYSGLDATKCDEVFSCWDKKLGFLWGGMSDDEFQKCLAGFSLDKASTEKIWCHVVDDFELNDDGSPSINDCLLVIPADCIEDEGVNFGQDEMACLMEKNETSGGNNDYVWCFSPETKACYQLSPKNCVAPMQNLGPGDTGKTKCVDLGGNVSAKSCRYEKINVTPETLGAGAVCVPCDCPSYGCDLGGTTMKLWGQYADEVKCVEAIKNDAGGIMSTDTVAKKEAAVKKQAESSAGETVTNYFFDGASGLCLGCLVGASEGSTACPKTTFSSEAECNLKNNILDIGKKEVYCLGGSFRQCVKCVCGGSSVGKTCEVGGINYSNLSVYESELLCASAAESLESGFQAAISQCGGKEMGIYNKLPLYSESSTGQTCGRYDQLNIGSQALFSQFCGTDCDVGGGICKSRKGDPDITVACGKYCKVSGTSCVTDDSKSGGFLGKKFFEICNDYGSVLTANVIYCAREANCNQEQLKGLCKWQL